MVRTRGCSSRGTLSAVHLPAPLQMYKNINMNSGKKVQFFLPFLQDLTSF